MPDYYSDWAIDGFPDREMDPEVRRGKVTYSRKREKMSNRPESKVCIKNSERDDPFYNTKYNIYLKKRFRFL